MNFDRETLRALADEGNEKAMDRLADLADERGDLDELNELLDEGCQRAGHLLTRRAVAAGDAWHFNVSQTPATRPAMTWTDSLIPFTGVIVDDPIRSVGDHGKVDLLLFTRYAGGSKEPDGSGGRARWSP